jgi:hypothetical protein
MYRIYILILILVLGGIATATAEDGDGGYAGAFLQVPIGARPAAMGGAYLSLSTDGTGALYNPAGLASIRSLLFSSSYRLMDLDRTLSYVSVAIPTAKLSTIGFGWRYAGSGSVEARNSDGDPLGFELVQHNHEFHVVFAKRFERFFSAGFKGSYLHSQFNELSSFSVSLDMGLMFHYSYMFPREKRELMPVQDITIGVVVRNLGAKYRWNNERYLVEHFSSFAPWEQEDEIPIQFGLGGSARFLQRKLLIAIDGLGDLESRYELHGGAEYFVSPQFALRAGYSDERLTAGTGYLFKFTNLDLAIDYAFSTDKADEGSEHIFSFDLIF